MAFRLKLHPRAEKQLNNIPSPYNERIKATLSTIANNPWIGKKLKGEYEGSYTVRVWPYRIIYDINKHELLVMVIKIKHRGQGAYA
jgi:mRNA-degrading endonuclease RelE of RelBE toxin-antitoxin system